METIFYIVYAAFLAVMSLLAIILYAGDKKKAKKGAWRTPESVLLGFGFFGGAIGALIAMNSFRHKTKHWYFWVVNVLGLIWQIALPIVIFVLL
jgi:uncharacterized membrane protein YsdA (DUF1294 family)